MKQTEAKLRAEVDALQRKLKMALALKKERGHICARGDLLVFVLGYSTMAMRRLRGHIADNNWPAVFTTIDEISAQYLDWCEALGLMSSEKEKDT